MKQFILLSFGFMGWTFYEMSGGDAFEPDSLRKAALQPEIQKPVEQPVVIQASAFAPVETAVVDTDPPLNPVSAEVTRVALNLTTLQGLESDLAADEGDIITASASNDIGVPQNVGTLLSSADTPAIIPSLINPADGQGTNAALGLQTIDDVRRVSGNRVNVRGGPGTNFGVVSKLVQGDAVEVLIDDGNGWVKMRPLDGGPEGWMADFLLES